MPANIVFSLQDDDSLIASLVDFELAQDLKGSSPEYVSQSVQELYKERDVPRNSQTRAYTKNLDQHIISQAIVAIRGIRAAVKDLEGDSEIDWLSLSISIPFLGGFSINVGKAIRYWQERLP